VEAPEAESVALCPGQMPVGEVVAITVGTGFTVTVTVEVPEHPGPEVPVTE